MGKTDARREAPGVCYAWEEGAGQSPEADDARDYVTKPGIDRATVIPLAIITP